eukprot:4559161-Amphidinium_carterae.1
MNRRDMMLRVHSTASCLSFCGMDRYVQLRRHGNLIGLQCVFNHCIRPDIKQLCQVGATNGDILVYFASLITEGACNK